MPELNEKTNCERCGKLISIRNMARHMDVMHNTPPPGRAAVGHNDDTIRTARELAALLESAREHWRSS